MVLEATMIIMDNSDWSRNGDYPTTRFDAQRDAIQAIYRHKLNANQESSVGLVLMADTPQVAVTLSRDIGKALTAIHSAKISGEAKFANALQVARLGLKHRENKLQRQRIICFMGSPLMEKEEDLVRIAKDMKKNNIAVDIINFGDFTREGSDKTPKLMAFYTNINNQDNSHIITISPGPTLMSTILQQSPILAGENNSINGTGDFGVEEELDPELAMALRMSLEDEQLRRENT